MLQVNEFNKSWCILKIMIKPAGIKRCSVTRFSYLLQVLCMISFKNVDIV